MHKSGKKILGLFAVIILLVIFFRLVFPPLSSKLTNTSWCVDKVYFKGRRIGPHTLHAVYMVYNGKMSCVDQINFMDEGDIKLPGLNTRGIEGNWQTGKDDSLQIKTDTLQDVYQGAFGAVFSGDSISLKSKTTLIQAHR